MKTNELKLIFLYGMEPTDATPSQLEDFKKLSYNLTKLVKGQHVKTPNIYATFEYFGELTNTVYLREL
jgi:hypothetical protein